MTRVMIFDTETTGLPERGVYVVENHNLHLWPHIVQLSYIIYDNEINKIIKQKDTIIKIPNNINVSDGAVLIHGITSEISKSIGKDCVKSLMEFMEDYSKIDVLIAHNIKFDVNMIRVELLRHVLYDEFNKLKDTKAHYCTMNSTIKLCNLKYTNHSGKELPKFPKLSELHQHLFNTEVEKNNLHNALNDVLICLRCYFKVKFNEDVCLTNRTLKTLIYNLLK
jgi:DNA polymerase-3 subunit epsilon